MNEPRVFVLGEGVTLLARAYNFQNGALSPHMVFRDLPADGPDAVPFLAEVPHDHPATFRTPEGEAPTPLPSDTVSLFFANRAGLLNLIHELLILERCAYPEERWPDLSPGGMAEVFHQKRVGEDVRCVAQALEHPL